MHVSYYELQGKLDKVNTKRGLGNYTQTSYLEVFSYENAASAPKIAVPMVITNINQITTFVILENVLVGFLSFILSHPFLLIVTVYNQ